MRRGSGALFSAIGVVGLLLTSTANAGPAVPMTVSSSGFIGKTPTDQAQIVYGGIYIYNADQSSSHNVVANMGMEEMTNGAQFHVFVSIYNYSGATLSCTAYIVDTAAHWASGTASTTQSGVFNLAVPLTVPVGNGAYFLSLMCTLPHASGGNVSTIYGASVGA